MTLSVASKNHLAIIKYLAYQIWPDTYGATHSQEELDYMLTKFYSIESLENQLENGHVFILVSENNMNLGFISFEINAEKTTKTKIHKLYVLPQNQGKGIGMKLVDYVKNESVINENTALFLNVNKQNNAQEFYVKYGFNVTKDIIIDIGNGYIMDDYVMELNLIR
jgi:ribosomal protein S18 acetylase RimI-like enzyme